MNQPDCHNENEFKDYRIGQLENALAELLVEVRHSWEQHAVSGRVAKAWTNANLILNEN
jgi:hypothetical protein